MWILFRIKKYHIHIDLWTCIKSKDRSYFVVIGRYEISRNVVITYSDCLALLFLNRSPDDLKKFHRFSSARPGKMWIVYWNQPQRRSSLFWDVTRYWLVVGYRRGSLSVPLPKFQDACLSAFEDSNQQQPLGYPIHKSHKPHQLSSAVFSVRLSQSNHSKLNNQLDTAS